MTYYFLCDVKAKPGYEDSVDYLSIDISVSVLDYNGSNYGNGKELFIQIGHTESEFIDIRYDRNYYQMPEHLYIQEFLKTYARNNLIFEITQLHLQSIYE